MESLRVVTGHRPPLVFVSEQGGTNQRIYSGYLIELLPALLQHAGINASYTIYNIEVRRHVLCLQPLLVMHSHGSTAAALVCYARAVARRRNPSPCRAAAARATPTAAGPA